MSNGIVLSESPRGLSPASVAARRFSTARTASQMTGSCAAVVRSIFAIPLSVNAWYGASLVGRSAFAVIQPYAAIKPVRVAHSP